MINNFAKVDANLLKQILYKYTGMGAHVFPLCWPEWDENGHVHCGYGHINEKGQPETENIGKRPLLDRGYHNSTQTHAGIGEWLRKYPKANWGAHWDNQFALDVDQDNGAFNDLARLITDIGELPPTLEQVSGSLGLHKIYLLPDGLDIKASNLPGYDRIHVKINGYVVVAGSLHKYGRLYSIKNDTSPVQAPQSLINLFLTKRGKQEINSINVIKSGGRHVNLISLIGKLRNDKFSEDLIETMAQAANSSADIPLSKEEIIKMVREYEHQNKTNPINVNPNDTTDSEPTPQGVLATIYPDSRLQRRRK